MLNICFHQRALWTVFVHIFCWSDPVVQWCRPLGPSTQCACTSRCIGFSYGIPKGHCRGSASYCFGAHPPSLQLCCCCVDMPRQILIWGGVLHLQWQYCWVAQRLRNLAVTYTAPSHIPHSTSMPWQCIMRESMASPMKYRSATCSSVLAIWSIS